MTPLSWPQIARLGLVQSAIGAMVMLSTSLLNRVMVVEYALPAAVPAGLVAWHYAIQLSRPAWGHGSDKGRRRTPWIIGGMAVLATGSMLAVVALIAKLLLMSVIAYALIGAGVGAAGTSLLALLATRTAPERRAGAASLTWIMMIVGIIVAAGTAGRLLEPFSAARLVAVVGGVALVALTVAVVGVWGIDGEPVAEPRTGTGIAFGTALREIWADPEARGFTVFVFMSMLAYSMQDMILEPFAGLMFAYTPGQSTSLSGLQHQGVLVGMILVGFGARTFGGGTARGLRSWTIAGCIGSAMALAGLATAAHVAPHWPFAANVALLGFCNGVFAVSAIGAMMALAGQGGERREGIRMGVWGAAQAIAFGLGGLTGAVGVDAMRTLTGTDGLAFSNVFAVEAALFLVAAWLAAGAVSSSPAPAREVLA
jgi:MFS transporter, BCD family, chlorophyll transporter